MMMRSGFVTIAAVAVLLAVTPSTCSADTLTTRRNSPTQPAVGIISQTSQWVTGKDTVVKPGWQLPAKRSTLIQIGCILAFQNGLLNGLSLGNLLHQTSKGNAVAAVTGAWTTSALGVAQNNGAWKTPTACILSYMAGSCGNTLFNPTPGKITSPTPILIAAGLVAAAQYAGIQQDLALWCTLAVATGMINSWTSQLCAGNLLRSAHFSGITSDIGTFLGQMIRGQYANAEKCRIFALVAASFWAGGYASVPLAQRLPTSSLTVPLALLIGMFGYLMVQSQ